MACGVGVGLGQKVCVWQEASQDTVLLKSRMKMYNWVALHMKKTEKFMTEIIPS